MSDHWLSFQHGQHYSEAKLEERHLFDLYTAVILITNLFLLITIADTITNRLITNKTKIRTVLTCLVISFSTVGECLGVLTNGSSVSLIPLHRIAKVIEFCCAPFIGIAAAIAYGHAMKPKLVIGLTAAHAAFEIIAVPLEWVFSIDSQNIYHRQTLYAIYVIVFLFSIGYCLVSLIRIGKTYQIGVDSVLLLTMLMVVIGIAIQFVYSNIRIDYLCIAVGNMLLYNRYYKTMLQVDAVTQLLNRRCYDVNIADTGSHAVVLFFDVDKFKQVNDRYGHSVGDTCLRNVAMQLRTVYGRHGLCYRIGGDEFCVILREGIENVEELNRQFASTIKCLQRQDSRMPSVSLGYAYYDSATCHMQNVIEAADAMLYKNKARAFSEEPKNA